VNAHLFDPLGAPDGAWPPGSEAVRAYLDGFARAGSQHLIANVRTRVLALRAGDAVVPVTVNDEERGNSYVCSPHNAYADYAREEMRLIPGAFARAALQRFTGTVSAALRAAHADRIVHVNNWLLSTNLYDSEKMLDPAAVARAVTAEFPDHFLCLRSLNGWANAELIARLRGAGFGLLASRQVYVFDRLHETYAPRSNSRYDRRLLAATPYEVVEHDALGEADYARMAELYALLYLEKYSRHNPAFTADYLRLCHRANVMRFIGLRAASGRLDGVLGLFALNGTVTAPVVGYDTALDRRAGLYRLLMALVFRWAQEHGHVVNLSSGAAEFKRLRGGRAVIEYSAVYDRHLAAERRAAMVALRALLDGVAVPVMRRLAV
jgi:Acetyltransferase (GNAT) domain